MSVRISLWGACPGLVRHVEGGSDVQFMQYEYDAVGNMTKRSDSRFAGTVLSGSPYTFEDVIDEFTYDKVNRLTSADLTYVDDIAGEIEVLDYDITYDAAGRRDTLNHQGSSIDYTYDPNHIHGVKSTNDGKSYSYDAVGNQIVSEQRTLSYTAFNKAKHISNSNGYHQVAYTYGSGNEKLTRTDTENGDEKLTWYVGNVEIITTDWEGGVPGSITSKRYVGDAVVTHHGPEVIDVEYIHKDHLGSTQVISRQRANQTGAAGLYHVSYDAFGKVRGNVSPTSNFSWLPTASVTNKGFTGQDHISELGLINFNARLYDPTLGMMLQADTIIPDGPAIDSLNRYAYVYNNPLSYTDPSGHNPMWGGHLNPAVQNTANNHVRNGNLQVQSKAMQESGAAKFLSAVRKASTSGTPAGTQLSGYANFDVFLQQGNAQGFNGTDVRNQPDGENLGYRPGLGLSDSNGNQITQGRQGGLINLGTRQEQIDNFFNVAKGAAGLFDISQGVRGCYSDSCGVGGWILGGLEAIPLVKWGRRGGDVLDRSSDITQKGVFSPHNNSAGGTVWTSNGNINQNDFSGIVTNNAQFGNKQINILTGAHGDAKGSLFGDISMFNDDVKTFGNIPNVNIHNIMKMQRSDVNKVLNSDSIVVGGFCHSGVCLDKFK